MNPEVKIAGQPVGQDHPCMVVAEIGINHNGSVDTALRQIELAHEAGADAVKFQKRDVPIVFEGTMEEPFEVPAHVLRRAVARNAIPASDVERLQANSFQDARNSDFRWAIELTVDEYKEVDAFCRELGFPWFASPWDESSVDFLMRFGTPCFKVASASLTDHDLLKHMRETDRPIIMSVGMSTMEEVRSAVEAIGTDNLVLLHTVSTYPSADEELNLSAMETLREEFPDVPIGYSGHEAGTALSLCAAAMGACMVERHFTLDKGMWGPDQFASIDPEELLALVTDIRRFETARGDGVKRFLEAEQPAKDLLRRK